MAERIKELRERRSYGQAELARLAGISPNALWRIESGMHEPRPVTVRKIAEALGVDVEILTGKGAGDA
jgi:transcriptional regulator with XRE-family HTH domain